MMTTLRAVLALITAWTLGVAPGFGNLSSDLLCNVRNTPSLIVARTDGIEIGTEEEHISPFWGGAIHQWDRWIVYWAEQRELDPDLVAAVIRKESIGRSSAEGPYGAVGLMMVLPAEASGMPWRPSAKELKQPSVNLRWGTGILKEVIRESSGDLLMALAAYNGGWDQLHLASTKRYAHSVLTYYAYAIAARHGYGYQESKVWTMVIMTRVDGHIDRIWTDTSGHFLAPCFDSALGFRDLYPEMVDAPRTRVSHYVDPEGHDVLIDAWLFVGGRDRNVKTLMAGTAPPTLAHIGLRP